ncbi:amidohydrolase [Paracoccus sp. S1E-3]|uniref:amidohydrolase n=1 Tax=Paracoccus sp. S1E-3 TaxID=2756130 RepID=UPI0015EE72A2|nr:amidohydrolase [Paracoccus sp. S1E-3]MBA4491657.1 amidohydrolase [Paracoccus sp. S1E-3]
MTPTLFSARRIITMDPSRPEATHVLVSGDGRILAVGTPDEMGDSGEATRDDRFADKILMPGFVEGHAHMMEGSVWRFTYLGHYARIAPDGRHWDGITSTDALIARLRERAAELGDGPVVGWGFDPLFVPGERLSRLDLDRVSTTQPVVVLHSNMHLLTANSAALELAGYDENTDVPGVLHSADGQLHGELHEMAAMFPVMRRVGASFRNLGGDPESIWNFARSACRAGVTTSTDLLNDLAEETLADLLATTGEDGYPLRVVPMLSALAMPPTEVGPRALELRARSTDRLRMGGVKIITDGSIQGFTAQLLAPGYYRGTDNGIWNIAPEALNAMVDDLNRQGIQMHIHVNGDGASLAAIEALEAALAGHFRPDHRHTLQHCQMADRAQLRRIAALQCCVNLFANHLYYFGDKHYEITIGPERACRMNPCASALELGIPLAIHSDAPITPLAPLVTAWCAINRLTDGGRQLGTSERISLDQALYAITLGAAHTLKLDAEIGSVEVGKRADFAVLEDDPHALGAERLREVRVWGTIFGGQPVQTGSF